jgi:O-antigen ligase
VSQGEISQPGVSTSIGDACILAFGILLAGYAISGKTFAYFGIAPLHVGEMAFGLGIVALLLSRCGVAVFAAMPNVFLGLLMGWVVVRTIPYVGEFGVDALRDSVIVLYGGFALIMTALLVEKPDRLERIVRFLCVLSIIIVPLAPIILILSDDANFNGSAQTSLAYVKPGTMAVHLAGAALVVLLGFRRAGIPWLLMLCVGFVAACSQNRGGMVAALVMLTIGVVAAGKVRQFSGIVAIAIAIIGIAYAADLSIETNRDRDISARQMVDNFVSIFEPSENKLDRTKAWRFKWWETIIDYTVNGPYFWTGKGFGVSLALADGFVVGLGDGNPNIPLLRSPHNGHFTILARSGVPGLVLWFVTLIAWNVMMVANIIRARLRGDRTWANFFVLIFCYALGFLIDATFDVTLEGPMAGIWFWWLIGVGTGATMIYRATVLSVPQTGRAWLPDASAPKSV